MTSGARATALAALQAVVLSLGVGMAMAHETPKPVVAAPAPEPREPHVRPVARPTAHAVASPAPKRHRAAPHVVQAKVPSRPRATHTTFPRPVATHQSAEPRPATRSLSAQDRLMAAVARIPGYRTGEAVWSIRPGMGNWGMAVMGGATVYISPDVPADKLYDVVVHEWSHLLSIKAYGGDVTMAIAAMDRYFGGTDLVGAERAADCMARELGARWTHYTPCTNATWREGARRLIARQRL